VPFPNFPAKTMMERAAESSVLALTPNTEVQLEHWKKLTSDPRLEPFSLMVQVEDAAIAMHYLQGVIDTSPKGRAIAEKLIDFYMSDVGFKSGVHSALRQLDIAKCDYDEYLIRKWLSFWPFVTMLIARKVHNSKHRVDSATLEAAINGSHQDRRLFYEVFGGLKKDEGRGGSTTLIFINDNMHRPQFESEARKAAAVLIERVADLEEDSAPEAIEALTDL